MKKNKYRVKLSVGLKLNYYFPSLFLLIVPIMTLIKIITFIFNSYAGIRPIEDLFLPALLFFILSISSFISQYRSLFFRKVNIQYTESQFQDAIKRTVNELEWEIIKNTKKQFRAQRHEFIALWGEMITIMKEDGCIYINSICDPDKWASFTSYGWNRKNRNIFLKHLNNAVEGIEETPIMQKKEDEWSTKRIITRIIAYPLCVLFIILGIYMLFAAISLKNMFAGVGMIGLAVIYLYADIKLIMKNKD